MSDTQITSIGVDRLSELEPLWRSLHQHHRSVADLPVLADDDLSWQRRRDGYRALLEGGDAFVLLATAGETPVGYAVVEVRPGDDDTWPVGCAPGRAGLARRGAGHARPGASARRSWMPSTPSSSAAGCATSRWP